MVKFLDYFNNPNNLDSLLLEEIMKGRSNYWHGSPKANLEITKNEGKWNLFYFTTHFGYALNYAYSDVLDFNPNDKFEYKKINNFAKQKAIQKTDFDPNKEYGVRILECDLKEYRKIFDFEYSLKNNVSIINKEKTKEFSATMFLISLKSPLNLFNLQNSSDKQYFIESLKTSKYGNKIPDYSSIEFSEKLKKLFKSDWAKLKLKIDDFYGLRWEDIYYIIGRHRKYAGINHYEIELEKEGIGEFPTIGIFKDQLENLKYYRFKTYIKDFKIITEKL